MYHQRHFFCGIAGWPLALELAGWRWPCFTASLPCQSFSLAGNNEGFNDPRGQLWYPFIELVKRERPWVIFGEQVEAAIGKGWIDRVQADLEAEGYTFGFVVLGAHSVGAPHKRQRIFWVATLPNPERNAREPGWASVESRKGDGAAGAGAHAESGRCGGDGLGDAGIVRCDEGQRGDAQRQAGARGAHRPVVDRPSQPDIVANLQQSGLEGHARHGDGGREPGREQAQSARPATEGGGLGNADDHSGWQQRGGVQGAEDKGRSEQHADCFGLGNAGAWSDYDIIDFRDGSKRRIKRGVKPLAPGLPKGVVRGGNQGAQINADNTAEARRLRLHGFGNSIVPQLAAEFVKAFMETINLK